MTSINITVTGNLTADAELRYTATGVPVASFSVASNERYKDAGGEWQDGSTSFVRCNAWRSLGEHVAESLAKGDRVVVTGILRQRDYEAADKTKRVVWEVACSEVGAALRYATVKISKARRDDVPIAEDPWTGADSHPADRPAPAEDEPPF